ncbi:hypothetical protein VNO80_19253 [Phaseolus coccineus]|uniref:Uncharacterized protein n=1 Tax=Phaseolus coccineus TaxID=3886 RepID=A0AAN9MGY9_PHACN
MALSQILPRGVDWDNSRAQIHPKLALKPGTLSPTADDVHDSSWSPSRIRDGFAASVRQFDGATSSDRTGHITRLASIDSFDSKWVTRVNLTRDRTIRLGRPVLPD